MTSEEGQERFLGIHIPPETFIHPERGTLPAELPMGGQGIRDIVDAPRHEGPFAFARISQREVPPRNLSEANHGPAQVFSIVPPEWGRAIDKLIDNKPMEEVIASMYEEHKELPYYKSGQNAAILEKIYDTQRAEMLNQAAVKVKIKNIFGAEGNKRKDLEEMGMFPLQINVINIPGQVA